MKLFTLIGDALFGWITGPWRRLCRTAYALALSTYHRHVQGKPPEPASSMGEACRYILKEDARTGKPNWTTDYAKELLDHIEGRGPMP